jgi:hypothetical protein
VEEAMISDEDELKFLRKFRKLLHACAFAEDALRQTDDYPAQEKARYLLRVALDMPVDGARYSDEDY